MTDLHNRVALVSGGGRGIGRAISIHLSELGAPVAVNYCNDRSSAEETVATIKAAGGHASAYCASIEDPDACESMVRDVTKTLGPIGILINNGGVASTGRSVAQTSIEEWNRVIHTNLFGSFHLSRATLAQMRQLDRGDIVMISSACTRWHYAYGSPYNVAKAGLEELAFTLAYEERKHGIRVNIVAPGLVATEMGDRLARAVNNVDTTADLDDVSPFGHVCRPEEIANVVGFLVSGTGAYVSGQRIYVDGAASPRAT